MGKCPVMRLECRWGQTIRSHMCLLNRWTYKGKMRDFKLGLGRALSYHDRIVRRLWHEWRGRNGMESSWVIEWIGLLKPLQGGWGTGRGDGWNLPSNYSYVACFPVCVSDSTPADSSVPWWLTVPSVCILTSFTSLTDAGGKRTDLPIHLFNKGRNWSTEKKEMIRKWNGIWDTHHFFLSKSIPTPVRDWLKTVDSFLPCIQPLCDVASLFFPVGGGVYFSTLSNLSWM